MPETALLTRYLPTAELKATSSDRTLTFSFSSSRPVERYGFFEDNLPEGASYIFDEILSHDASAWNLERVETGVCPFLRGHNRDSKLGIVTAVDFKGEKGYATVKLRQVPEASQLLIDIEDGTVGGISFGYSVQKYRVVSPAQYDTAGKLTKKAVMEATAISLYEISEESIPADPTVGFGRSEKNLISLRTLTISGDPQWNNKKISANERSLIRARENYESAWKEKINAQKSSLSIQDLYQNAWKK